MHLWGTLESDGLGTGGRAASDATGSVAMGGGGRRGGSAPTLLSSCDADKAGGDQPEEEGSG